MGNMYFLRTQGLPGNGEAAPAKGAGGFDCP